MYFFFGQVLELCGRLLWRAFFAVFFFHMGIFLYIHLNFFALLRGSVKTRFKPFLLCDCNAKCKYKFNAVFVSASF